MYRNTPSCQVCRKQFECWVNWSCTWWWYSKHTDLNQNISVEIEAIDCDNDLRFEETEVEEEIIVREKTSKKPRGSCRRIWNKSKFDKFRKDFPYFLGIKNM